MTHQPCSTSAAHRHLAWESAVSLAVLSITTPLLCSAQNTIWLTNVSSGLLSVADAAVIALTGLALMVFIWGMVVFLANAGNEQKRTSGKQHMVWGILAIAVLVSLWGLVGILQVLTGTASPASFDRPSVSLTEVYSLI